MTVYELIQELAKFRADATVKFKLEGEYDDRSFKADEEEGTVTVDLDLSVDYADNYVDSWSPVFVLK